MGIAIEDIRPASSEEWDAVWRACPYGTYFQSREWAEIWSAYDPRGLAPAPMRVRFSDGQSALLPLSRRRHLGGLSYTYVASPAGTFGGWLSADPIGREHVAQLVRYLTRHDLVWRVSPYADPGPELGGLATRADTTLAVDLRDGFPALLRQWSKGHRATIGQARRNQISVAESRDRQDWETYFEIYGQSLDRWGSEASSRYGWPLFAQLRDRASPSIKLWLALLSGRPVAGALVFHAQRHAVYWHGAALSEHFPKRPVHLLVHDIMHDAAARGLAWFDFNPSGGHEGVAAFKRGFGAQPLPAPVVHTRTLRGRCVRRLEILGAAMCGATQGGTD